jgi:hypothetical protein
VTDPSRHSIHREDQRRSLWPASWSSLYPNSINQRNTFFRMQEAEGTQGQRRRSRREPRPGLRPDLASRLRGVCSWRMRGPEKRGSFEPCESQCGSCHHIGCRRGGICAHGMVRGYIAVSSWARRISGYPMQLRREMMCFQLSQLRSLPLRYPGGDSIQLRILKRVRICRVVIIVTSNSDSD